MLCDVKLGNAARHVNKINETNESKSVEQYISFKRNVKSM